MDPAEDGAEVCFRVLGQMHGTRDGAAIATGSPQQQAMLAVLLLRAGHDVPVQDLITAVWGEAPPDTALATIRTYAWRWRRALGESREQPHTLLSAGDGYRLVLEPWQVDALRAERLATQAFQAREAGRHDRADALVWQALELWRGDPLTGVPGPFAEQQRRRLGELRLSLLEEHFELQTVLGRHLLTIPGLSAFIDENPLRERAYGLLMRALYAGGRQVEALAVYARLRRHLNEELGVDPGPAVRLLQRQILANDPGLLAADRPGPADGSSPEAGAAARRAGAAGADAGPGPGTASGRIVVPAQLPPAAADFTGREDVLTRLCAVLGGGRREVLPVVSVTGMGGVGKTTLALRAAHRAKDRFPDGQLYTDLRGSDRDPLDPAAVLAAFLTALGTEERRVPAGVEERSRLFRTMVDGRRVLVVLDNARDLAQIEPLLPGAASCAVLVTGRARLVGLPVDEQVDLAGFRPDEALELLARIAGRPRVEEDLAGAREVLRLCGHLPLAVRIAAARLAARPGWSVAELARRLADERRRIGELRAGELAVEAAFEVGHEQLTAAQARAFRLTAAVADPDIGTPAAAAVLALDPHRAEDLLESLVDAAMLESPAGGRYRFHSLMRAFALHRPVPPGAPGAEGDRETDGPGTRQGAEGPEGALGRLVDFLLATAAAAFAAVVPGDAARDTFASTRARVEHFTDAGAARAWAAQEFPGACSAVLAAATRTVAHQASGAGGGGSPPGPDATVLGPAVDLLIAFSAFGAEVQRERLAAVALAAARSAEAVGDHRSVGRARFLCGNLAVQGVRLQEASAHLDAAAVACRRAGDVVILRQTLNDLGLVEQFQHRHEEAIRHFDEAITLARELGQRSGEWVTRVNAALARLSAGQAGQAVRACEEALPVFRGLSDTTGTAYALYVLGLGLHRLGRDGEAEARLRECLGVCQAAGLDGRQAQARYRLADVLRALGRLDDAVAEAERSLELCVELRAERDQGLALTVLGRALAEHGRIEAARTHLWQARSVFERLGLPEAAWVGQELARLAG
ncbi:AfsR/SARP family transcriptional regulator [Streptacidiphilus neutrinimicus]|uniref:AfsR/SARP family transcriptional regulator n=1 Tax=Streptacidiphilus neutrinimicus TaxID=105420 RepID=UPI000AD77A0B|nr:BTAD domain-containing putative transcriptional regulator [Streptacidiphilus neutrinimicus]